jgi:hypothetical protein
MRIARFAAFTALVSCQPLSAGDGVIEINQAKALAGGVTVGDTAGFPVTLSASGSYRLTGNLNSASLSAHILDITAATGHVTIDLNGFTIAGPGLAGAGNGIHSPFADTFVTVRNGHIRACALHGISIEYGLAEELVLLGNGSNGIWIGNTGIVSRVQALFNGDYAIQIWKGVVRDSLAVANFTGIQIFGEGVIDSCVVSQNEQYGIELVTGTVKGTVSSSNGDAELRCNSACAITGNQFLGCTQATCIGGAGTVLELPSASNTCGGFDPCP